MILVCWLHSSWPHSPARHTWDCRRQLQVTYYFLLHFFFCSEHRSSSWSLFLHHKTQCSQTTPPTPTTEHEDLSRSRIWFSCLDKNSSLVADFGHCKYNRGWSLKDITTNSTTFQYLQRIQFVCFIEIVSYYYIIPRLKSLSSDSINVHCLFGNPSTDVFSQFSFLKHFLIKSS